MARNSTGRISTRTSPGSITTNQILSLSFCVRNSTRRNGAASNGALAANRYWVINGAGFALRALGRLADAVEPAEAAAELLAESEDLWNAAQCSSNLSALHLTLGRLPEAIGAARQALDFADRSDDEFRRMAARTILGDALHQSGDLAEAMQLFDESERLQAKGQTTFTILYAIFGYRYCDVLVDQGQTTDVLRRASQMLRWAEERGLLLDIGLSHLLLGRSHRSGSVEAIHHLNQAVDFLRRAGLLQFLAISLLARGTPHDLDEAFRIGTRSGMRLYLADYHLTSSRLSLSNGDRTTARDHLTKAEALINETGYHRRDPELKELRSQLS